MHIALLSPGWPLEKHQNGIVTYVHWMKREFEARGHRVSVFTGNVAPTDLAAGVYSVRAPPLTLWGRARRRLRKLRPSRRYEVFDISQAIAAAIAAVHRRDPIDVVEMEESFGWFADVARRTAIPLVVKLHGPAFLSMVEHEPDTPFGREKILREGRALRCATTITSPSQATLTQTVEHYQLRPAILRVVENPVAMAADTPLWQLAECDRERILFVGRFDLRKGADILLKAFASLLTSRPGLRLVFAGPDRGLSTAAGQHIHFEAYRDQLFAPHLRRQIDFLGAVSHLQVPRLRSSAMVTVVASRWENSGYTLLEAMLQGCPVVSTDAGGCPESVHHGVNGRLARSEDPASFAAQILALLDDPAGAARLGSEARRHVLERHAAGRVADAMLEAYAETIAAHRSSGAVKRG
jgi:glycosyltransferase involved in cell wall biosynthesis